MQPNTFTPAEDLLQSLLRSENLENSYSFVIEKHENHTNITLQFTDPKGVPSFPPPKED